MVMEIEHIHMWSSSENNLSWNNENGFDSSVRGVTEDIVTHEHEDQGKYIWMPLCCDTSFRSGHLVAFTDNMIPLIIMCCVSLILCSTGYWCLTHETLWWKSNFDCDAHHNNKISSQYHDKWFLLLLFYPPKTNKKNQQILAFSLLISSWSICVSFQY